MKKWDIFISHASEDKESVRPIVEALCRAGFTVWFDEQTLKLGDSLRQKIDEGLANCSFGVVFISEAFLNKEWPQKELDAFFSKEEEGNKVILPIWHEITVERVRKQSPALASKLAISTAKGTEMVVKAILDAIGIKKKSKASESVLQFIDDIIPDKVSVKFAIRAYKQGETDFSIEWPEATITYISRLQKLLDTAEKYRLPDSRFYQLESEIVAAWIDNAMSAINYVLPIYERAERRIPKLLQGMLEYFGSTTYYHEYALVNYLTLCSFEILHRVLYPFRLKVLYNEFFPTRYEHWYNRNRFFDIMPEIFDFDEPVYLAYFYSIGTTEMKQVFWGPKSKVLKAYDNLHSEKRINTSWLAKYIIPQNELSLLIDENSETVVYNDNAGISKVITETGNEL